VKNIVVLDKKQILCAYANKQLKLWDIESKKCTETTVSSNITLMMKHYDSVLVAHEDGSISIWKKNEALATCSCGPSCITCLVAVDEQLLACGFKDGTVKLLSIKGLDIQTRCTAKLQGITSLAFKDGILLAGDENGLLTQWDESETNITQQKQIQIHQKSITGIYMISKSKVVTSSQDLTIKISSLEKDQVLHTFFVHSAPIHSMCCNATIMLTGDDTAANIIEFHQNNNPIGLTKMLQ